MLHRILTILLLLAVAGFAMASDDPASDRGFKANGVYDLHHVDAVNGLSGVLTARIPLGQRYSSNGTLSYQFTLTYSSQIWDWILQQGGAGNDVTGTSQVGSIFGGGNDTPPAPATDSGAESYPSRNFNSGIGWTVTLGDLREVIGNVRYKFEYVGEDGAGHPFYNALHAGEVLPTPTSNTMYTRDSSYIRLVYVNATTYEVQLPDGIHKRFTRIPWPDAQLNHRWVLSSIADPFGNVLWVARTPSTPCTGTTAAPCTWTWKFTEATLGVDKYVDMSSPDALALTTIREHTLTFETVRWYEVRLKSMSLASPAGPAAYTFNYASPDVGIMRAMNSTWGDTATLYVPFDNSTSDSTITDRRVLVSMLQSISLPADAGSWSFNYYVGPCGNGAPQPCFAADVYPYAWNPNFKFNLSHRSGRLAEIVMPTGAALTYEYEPTSISQKGCGQTFKDGGGVTNVGVSKRKLWRSAGDVTGGNPEGTWRYLRTPGAPVSLDNSTCFWPKEFLSAAVDPNGTTTLSYFSIYISEKSGFDNFRGWTPAEWGMPLSRYEGDAATAAASTRFISSQVYQCGTALNLDDPATARTAVRKMVPRYAGGTTTCGAPLRSHYVRYDYSPAYNCGAGDDLSGCTASNQRVTSQLTRYHDDASSGSASQPPQMTVDSDPATFDGLGHFRKTTTASTNFKFDVSRTEIQDWNLGSSLTNVPTGGNWILETYDRVVAYEPVGNGTFSVRKSRSLFDANTGRLQARRIYSAATSTTPGADNDGIAAAANDTLTIYDRCHSGGVAPCGESLDPTAVQVWESHYGGDNANAGTSSAAPFTRPSTPEYSIVSRLRYGGTELRRYVNTGQLEPSSESSLTTDSNTVDPSSGLSTRSTQPSGLSEDRAYDALGRLKSLTSSDPAAASTAVEYGKATATTKAYVTVMRKKGATTFQSLRYEYDPIGRLVSEWQQQPGGGTYSLVTTEYDATGLVTAESTEAESTAAAHFTRYKFQDAAGKFDAFGRPRTITKPDGKIVTEAYNGIQTVNTTLSIATGNGTETDALSTSISDALGRLRRVTDFSSGNPASTATVATDYTYDAGGNLSSVSMDGSPLNQRRDFKYDGRNLLVTENLPELYDTATRYTYDSLAHLSTKKYGSSSTKYDVRHTYDFAGRGRKIFQISPNRLMKEITYFSSNSDECGNAGYAWGKIKSSTRYNYVRDPHAWSNFLPSFAIAESYRYGGVNGSLSESTTAGQRGEQFRSSYSYDPAGEPLSVVYPACNGTCGGTPARTVNYGYSYGRMVSVTGFGSISYHPNGLMEKVVHQNANNTTVTDRQSVDPTGMMRPLAIYTEGVAGAADWNPGNGASRMTYAYDGAGNIKSIRNASNAGDWFAYDKVGRLIRSSVGTDATGAGGVEEAFTYDRWGNLLATTRNNAPFVSFTTDGRNHLSASTYDAAGNVATNNAYTYEYDALGSMNFLISANESIPAGKVFLYGPSNDRIAVWDFKTGGVVSEAWSLRNAAGQVVRDVKRTDAGAWSWVKDYVYREGALMETVSSAGTRHVTVDHLGTPRLLTDAANGSRVAFHTYLPYGSEATASTDGERIKFAGSERDENDLHAGTQGGDLDYMHARYYRATQGRFLAMDPLGGDAANPQSWNRYAYVQDNPVNATDPTGRSIFDMVRMMRASAARQQSHRHSHRQHHQAKTQSQKGSATPNRTWTIPQYDSDGTSCISPDEKASQEAAQKQKEQQEAKRKSDAMACMNDAVCVANTWNLKKYDPNAPPEMSAITPLDEAMIHARELREDEEDLEWKGELIRHNSHHHESHEEGERMKNMEVHVHVMEMRRLSMERHALTKLLEEK